MGKIQIDRDSTTAEKDKFFAFKKRSYPQQKY
jgi:hypothetical protein